MVNAKSVEDQLKKLHFNKGWNRPETDELVAILLPDEEILECVSGWYEGGFALLCATNIRVLLIDKKPFKFLNIEDVRFDTINQIDYFHRMFNASICISAGVKKLTFRSYNQPRLRKLINHVQHRMAQLKTLEQAERAKNLGNSEEMDEQLKAYLLSQYEQSQPKLGLARFHIAKSNKDEAPEVTRDPSNGSIDINTLTAGVSTTDLYQDGIKEVFGRYESESTSDPAGTDADSTDSGYLQLDDSEDNSRDANALRIAYSKLPQILNARKRRIAAASSA